MRAQQEIAVGQVRSDLQHVYLVLEHHDDGKHDEYVCLLLDAEDLNQNLHVPGQKYVWPASACQDMLICEAP